MRNWTLSIAIVVTAVATTAWGENPVIVAGLTRFTVVTPNLIRIEYDPQGKFIDERSLFAANRASRFEDFQLTRDGNSLTIQTPAMRLSYVADGNAPGAGNLKADIRSGSGTPEWRQVRPADTDAGNLGGTIRTVDGVSGPVSLGQGVLSRDGWFLLDDSTSPLLTQDWVRARPEGGVDWYFFAYGTDYHAALKSLAAIGGPVPMPRKYALGAWYSRYWDYTAEQFKEIVREYAEHDFPLDMIVMDMDWHLTPERHGWTGYTWNEKLIPDPAGLLKWFHENGLHVTLNDHPADGVQPHEAMYEKFMRQLGRDPTTKETVPFDAADKRYLETFWAETHVPREQEGVDFWWLDWQQYAATRSIPQLTNLAWLNRFYYEKSERDGQRGISMSRWAGWGDHRHPIHFSGDSHTNWEMLAFEVPLTSTAGNVGCFFWSHDIGGHQGGRNDESYARWCQFGALSAALRSHSTRSADMDRRPWTYSAWAESSMRGSFHLRSELFPYIYSSVWQSTRDTIPLTRPMYLSQPTDEQAYRNPQQYLFGDDLLVAPIATPGVGPGKVAQQVVRFPAGTWFNYFTGERFEGDSEHLVAAGIDEFPLYVRGGTPIPMQPYTPRMSSAPLTSLVVRCYPGDAGSSTLYEDDGITSAYSSGAFASTQINAHRDATRTEITISPTEGQFEGQVKERSYVVVLPGLSRPTDASVDGQAVTSEYDPATCTAAIRVPAKAISRATTIVVNAPLADFTSIARETASRREQKAGADAAAYCMAHGVGLVRSVDSPTGYGDSERIRFYAPPGVIDGDSFEWSVDGQDGQAKATDGPALSIPITRDPLDLSFAHLAQVTFRVNGKETTQRQEWPAFGVLKSDRNLAASARLTASSIERNYDVKGAIDGSPSGYPARREAEWSSDGETVGAWIRLTWDTPQSLSSLALFDRPNLTDQVTAGTVRFSDGSELRVGELPDEADKPLLLRFEPKSVTWLEVRIEATKPGTKNAGLSEIATFGPGI